MSDPRDPDDIWQRALDLPDEAELPGDTALAAVLLAHGSIMNGGVLNFVEEYDVTEVDAAVAGYRWLGIDPIAELLVEVREKVARVGGPKHPGKLERRSDKAYAKVIDDDSDLEDYFRRAFAERPDDFAPLG